ncbi:hypothetical protein HDE_07948 [Halotydeus destructor]|nr:hypothetical protein HDE_07948 [Halotydeus destructor]
MADASDKVVRKVRSRVDGRLASRIRGSLPPFEGLNVHGQDKPREDNQETNPPANQVKGPTKKNKSLGIKGKKQHRFAVPVDSIPTPNSQVQQGLSPNSPLIVQLDLIKDCLKIGVDLNPHHAYYLGVINAGKDARYIQIQVVNPVEHSTLFLALGSNNYHGHEMFDYGKYDNPFPAGQPLNDFGKRAIPRTQFRTVLCPTNIEIFNGVELERFLSNHSDHHECCADAMGSRDWLDFAHHYSELYILRRQGDRNGLSSTELKVMDMRDIGVRTRRGQLYSHEFWKESKDEQYMAAMDSIREIKSYIIYPTNDQTIEGATVVLLNDIKPAINDSTMINIYGVCPGHTRMYGHQLYHNVNFMTISGDRKMTELTRHLFHLCDQEKTFSTIKVKDQNFWTLRTDFMTPEPLAMSSCSKSAPMKQVLTSRGIYNDFWSRVVDPDQKQDDQPSLICKWQQQYRPQFAHKGLYLAKPFEYCANDKLNAINVQSLKANGKLVKLSNHSGSSDVRFLSGRTHNEILAGDKDLQARYPKVLVKTFVVHLDASFGGNNLLFDFREAKEDLFISESEKVENLIKITQLFNNFYSMQEAASETARVPVNSSSQVRDNELQVPNETAVCLYFVNHSGTSSSVRIGVRNVPRFVSCYSVHFELFAPVVTLSKSEQSEVLRSSGHPLFDVNHGFPMDGFYKFDAGWRHELGDKRGAFK